MDDFKIVVNISLVYDSLKIRVTEHPHTISQNLDVSKSSDPKKNEMHIHTHNRDEGASELIYKESPPPINLMYIS